MELIHLEILESFKRVPWSIIRLDVEALNGYTRRPSSRNPQQGNSIVLNIVELNEADHVLYRVIPAYSCGRRLIISLFRACRSLPSNTSAINTPGYISIIEIAYLGNILAYMPLVFMMQTSPPTKAALYSCLDRCRKSETLIQAYTRDLIRSHSSYYKFA